MEDTIILEAWENFIASVEARFSEIHDKYPIYNLSEETFRLDFGYELSKCLGSTKNVYPEFPCDYNESQKWDLFFELDSGACIEMKFLREIPSGYNAPYTQHYGAVLADLLKLELLAEEERCKYFILICNDKFENHLLGQNIPLQDPYKTFKMIIDMNDLQSTAHKEIIKRLGDEVPEVCELIISVLATERIDDYNLHIIEISSV